MYSFICLTDLADYFQSVRYTSHYLIQLSALDFPSENLYKFYFAVILKLLQSNQLTSFFFKLYFLCLYTRWFELLRFLIHGVSSLEAINLLFLVIKLTKQATEPVIIAPKMPYQRYDILNRGNTSLELKEGNTETHLN